MPWRPACVGADAGVTTQHSRPTKESFTPRYFATSTPPNILPYITLYPLSSYNPLHLPLAIMTRELSRDERLRIRISRDNRHTYHRISQETGFTLNQIRYTCREERPTPQKKIKSGRLPKLLSEELDNIIRWIQSSIERRILIYEQLCCLLWLPIYTETLRTSLKKRGMVTHLAVQKPPIKPHYAQVRLE